MVMVVRVTALAVERRQGGDRAGWQLLTQLKLKLKLRLKLRLQLLAGP